MTMYLACFLAGLGLSVLVFFSGLHHIGHFGHHHFFTRGHFHFNRGQVPSLKGNAQTNLANPNHLPVINMAAVTAFLAWFGGAGVVLQELTTLGPRLILAASALVGTLGGSVVNRFINTLARDEQQLLPSSRIGLPARVISSIREGGTGEIAYTLNATRQTSGARSDDGKALMKGATVVITRYEKGIAYVSTFDELSAMTPES